MNRAARQASSKAPEVTLAFWVIKIAATTLGEAGGDAITMTLNLGYLVGAAIVPVARRPASRATRAGPMTTRREAGVAR